MDRRAKMVRYAPTMKWINTESARISRYKHHLSYGLWAFGALTFVLVSMRAAASLPLLIITLFMGALYWRWTFLSNQIRDTSIADYVLTDPVDLQWLEWARDLEPQVDLWLEKHRPNGLYTTRDFQQAYWRHAYYWADVPRCAPYYGDSEQCFEDLEVRRAPQRRARAERQSAAKG